jgi:hypothetical protein
MIPVRMPGTKPKRIPIYARTRIRALDYARNSRTVSVATGHHGRSTYDLQHWEIRHHARH